VNARLYFVHALSPLHAGTGQGSGVIDLPIAREKATGLPFLPGSSVKGVLRDGCDAALRTVVFGPDTANASDHAGAIQLADARMLLLPVRSLRGTFAWVTSPYVLQRFDRDARDAGLSDLPALPHIDQNESDTCAVTATSALKLDMRGSERVVIEDLDLRPTPTDSVTQWANWLGQRALGGDAALQNLIAGRLCVVHDDLLTFLLTTALEVTARVRLAPDAKTVERGALWYEEALPAETVLAGLAVATPNAKSGAAVAQVFGVLESAAQQTLQFGGKATVGRGLCRIRVP
jgi:CRISPR-associated protein Cmr4